MYKQPFYIMAKQTAQTAPKTTNVANNVINSEAATNSENGQTAENSEAEAEAEAEQTTEIVLNGLEQIAAFNSQIIELNEKRKQHKIKAREFEPDSDGENSELLEAWKIAEQIKAIEANIKQAEAIAELDLLRSKRIELNTQQFVLLFGSFEAFEQFKANIEIEQLQAFNAANEIVNNELLSKFAAAPKAASSKAATDGEIDKAALENFTNKLTAKQNREALQTAGFARSTSWFAVNRIQKAQAAIGNKYE